MKAPVDVTYLADTVILLRYFEAMGHVRRAVSVIKKRTGAHENTIREFRMAPAADRRQAAAGFQGVLRGVPTFVGQARPACLAIANRNEDFSLQSILRLLILAPHGRDAAVAASLLERPGSSSVICADLTAFCGALTDETCFAIVTEEALNAPICGPLRTIWPPKRRGRIFPFIMLTRRGGGPERNPGAARLSEALGNVDLSRASVSSDDLHQRRPYGAEGAPAAIRGAGPH